MNSNRTLKILFSVNGFPAPSETFIVNHIVAAINHGAEVTILANYKNTLKETSQKEIFTKYNLLDKTITRPLPHNNKLKRWAIGLKMALESFNTFKCFVKLINPFKYGFRCFNLNLFYACYPFIKLKHFDVYHAHFGQNAMGIAIAKELKIISSKLITTFHGYDAFYHSEREKRILTYNYKYVFKHSNYVTTNTPYLKNMVKRLGEVSPIILPMSINTSFFKPNKTFVKPSAPVQLISIGRLVAFKCHYLGIEAVSRLIKKGYQINYTIVGSGPEHKNLTRQIKELHLESQIHLANNKSQVEIKKILQESHIFLMTSNTDPKGRKETQGVVTIEAQACGLPVVAFHSGGVPYTLVDGETGFIAPEMDIDTFTDKLEQLVKDEHLRNTFSNNAVLFVKDNYSNQTCEKKLLKIYNA